MSKARSREPRSGLTTGPSATNQAPRLAAGSRVYSVVVPHDVYFLFSHGLEQIYISRRE